MRKRSLIVIPLVLLLLMGCATLKENWDKATPEQRAEVVLYGFQKALDAGLDAGIVYISAHPEKKLEWQTKIIPMFDATNKILRDLMLQGKAGKQLTYYDVAFAVVGRFAEINAALGGWGIRIQW